MAATAARWRSMQLGSAPPPLRGAEPARPGRPSERSEVGQERRVDLRRGKQDRLVERCDLVRRLAWRDAGAALLALLAEDPDHLGVEVGAGAAPELRERLVLW